MAFAALAPSLALELVALALAGAASITFMSTGNSTLQLTADPSMRGRVMSLWFVAFQGSTPIGGPVVGLDHGRLRRPRRARARRRHLRASSRCSGCSRMRPRTRAARAGYSVSYS